MSKGRVSNRQLDIRGWNAGGQKHKVKLPRLCLARVGPETHDQTIFLFCVLFHSPPHPELRFTPGSTGINIEARA